MGKKEKFNLLISRYLSQKDYFSNSNYLLSRNELIKNFIINFFNFLTLLDREEKIDDKFIDNLYFNIKNAYSLHKDINFQDKQNGEKRKIYLPYLYSFLEYELIVNQIILKTYDKIKKANIPIMLDKYFSYSHQFDIEKGKINSVHYIELWEKYIRFDELLVSRNKIQHNRAYYKQIDISKFYDSINHDDLIYEFSQFFDSSDKELLFSLKKSLQKISGFENIGLPQNIIGSDFLASLYIFLKFFNNKDYKDYLGDVKLIKIGDYICFKANYNSHDIYFTNYVDDFTFICKNYKALNQFIELKIIPFLNTCGLTINHFKTTSGKLSKINGLYKIDLKNIDIKELAKLFIENIPDQDTFKNGELNDIGKLKVYIKWFYRFNNEALDKKIKKELIKKLSYLITKSRKKLDYEKYFLLNLIRAYPLFFIELSAFLVNYDSNFKNTIEYFVKTYFIFISENSIGIIYLNLISKTRQNLVYSNISLLEKLLLEILKNKYDENKNLFIKEQSLKKFWLNILQHSYFDNYPEFVSRNISSISESDEKIGIKKVNFINLYLKDIFSLNISTDKIFSYLLNNNEEDFLDRINYILFELLKTKSLNNNFYYKTAAFIEDLYSLIILFLKLFLLLENKFDLTDDLSITTKFGYIVNKSKRNIEINLQNYKFNKSYLNFMYFILKKRAELVHKDGDMSNINEINELGRYNVYNNKLAFESTIRDLLGFIVKKIESNIT